MDLAQALKRAGITVVKADKQPNGNVVLMLRLGKDRGPLWVQVVEEFLLAAPEKGWRTDVSKAFFVKDGVVRFLWRVVLMGEVVEASEALANAAVRAMSANVEVKSKPLVGRVNYPIDPANGKMKGGHDANTAARLRQAGLGGG